jgi:hypothetical protein
VSGDGGTMYPQPTLGVALRQAIFFPPFRHAVARLVANSKHESRKERTCSPDGFPSVLSDPPYPSPSSLSIEERVGE